VSKGVISDRLPITAGVPQGSVLSPLLFLVFINDLPASVSRPVESGFFADDGCLYATPLENESDSTATHRLQAALNTATDWSRMWRVKFNISKCALLVFQRRHRSSLSSATNLILKLCGQRIPISSSYKYLGLHISDTLSWTEHANAVCSKANKAASFIHRLISPSAAPPPRVVRLLTNVLVQPIISYGLPLWSPPTQTIRTALDRILAEPLRRVLGLPAFAPRHAVFTELRSMDVTTLEDMAMARYAHRLVSAVALPAHDLYDAADYCQVDYHTYYAPRRHRAQAAYCKSLVYWVRQLEERLHMAVTAPLPQLRESLLRSFFSSYRSSHGGVPLFSHLDSPSHLPSYLCADIRSVACLRARLRLSVSQLAADRHSRHLIPDPSCSLCHASLRDRTHLIAACPALAAARNRHAAILLARHHCSFPLLSRADFLIAASLDILPACATPMRNRMLSVCGMLLTALCQFSITESISDPVIMTKDGQNN